MTTDEIAVQENAVPSAFSPEGGIRVIIFAAAFLVPLFFLPFTQDPLFGKIILIEIAALAAGALWLVGTLISKRIVYRKSPLNAGLAVLAITVLAAAIASAAPWSSFWGNDPTGEKAASVLALAVLAFVAAAVLKAADARRIAGVLLSSFALLGAVVLGALVLGKFGITPPPWLITNPVGTVNALALVLAAGFILAITLSITAAAPDGRPRISRPLAIFSSVVSLLLLGVLLFIGFRMVWIGIALIISTLIALHSARRSDDDGRLLGPRSLAIAFLLIILSLFFAFRGVPFAGIVFQPPLEVSPSLSGTLTIAAKVMREDPLLGIGPANFRSAFSRFREPVINQTPFWQVRFEHGFSYLATAPSTLGVLGIIALLIFIGIAAALTGRVLLSSKGGNPYLWGFGVLALFLIIEWFLYASNATASFLLFLALGLFSALLHEPRADAGSFTARWRVSRRAVEINVPALTFFVSLVMVFAAALAIVMLSGLGTSYAAAVQFRRGAEALNRYGNTDTAKAFFSSAIGLDSKNALYYQGQGELTLVIVGRLIASAAANPGAQANLAEDFQNEFSSGISSLERAIALGPSAERWAILGRLYEMVVPFIAGADRASISAYEEAIRLDPVDSLLPFARGRTLLTAADIASLQAGQSQGAAREQMDALYKEYLKSAHEALDQAIALKPDLAAARFLLAQTYLREGNTAEAIQRVEETARLAPLDIGVAFQLGFLYYRTNNLKRAEQEFIRAIAISPNYANARYFLGLIYERKGERKNAIAEFERIAALNPGNSEVEKILSNLRAGRPALDGIAAPAPELRRDLPVEESGGRR